MRKVVTPEAVGLSGFEAYELAAKRPNTVMHVREQSQSNTVLKLIKLRGQNLGRGLSMKTRNKLLGAVQCFLGRR